MKTFIILTVCFLLTTTSKSSPIVSDEDSDYIYSEPKENSRCIKDGDWEGPTLIYHESECGKFYMCMGGMAYEITCPRGKYWDRETHTCEAFDEGRCSNYYKNSN